MAPVVTRPLDAKLRSLDDWMDRACDELIRILTEEREYVKRVAAGRHAQGHWLYGDTLMYEYDARRLMAETGEELADAVVYTTRRLALEADAHDGGEKSLTENSSGPVT